MMKKTDESTAYFQVTEAEAGMRLDQWLALKTGLSRSALKKRIQDNTIEATTGLVKANRIVATGEVFGVQAKAALSPPSPCAMSLDVRYEDPYLLVVNKPVGMLVHPTREGDNTSLVSGLLAYSALAASEDPLRPGIVHRLDRDTSGLLVVAKTTPAYEKLKVDFSHHRVRRDYLAIVDGVPTETHMTISKPIAKTAHNRLKRMTVETGGRPAVTHVNTLLFDAGYALLCCTLETGRTHQIRVHLSALGYPIVGDPLYGQARNPFGFKGQALHAHHMIFDHPVLGNKIECWAPVPHVFRRAVQRLDTERRKGGIHHHDE